jgi:hypothetical protein
MLGNRLVKTFNNKRMNPTPMDIRCKHHNL